MKHKQHSGHNINPYGRNFRQRSGDATEGMLDVSKMVVAGAVTVGTIGLMGNILGGLNR